MSAAFSSISSLQKARARLLDELRQDVRDAKVLSAIARVPREEFVPAELRYAAYENRPLPIGQGQTISQPLIVGIMTQALGLTGVEKVLEIGTGSGYQTAILAELAATVVSVERIASLAGQAAVRLARLGYSNITVYVATEELGWLPEAPYDAILVTAAAPKVPQELLDQLAVGGRLVIPVGPRDCQELLLVVKGPEREAIRRLGPCRFVPLIGLGAWPDEAELPGDY